MSEAELTQVKSELASVSLQARIPPFWRENPRLWFAQFEAVVASQRIADEQKFNLVIPVLQRADIEQISDLILQPSAVGRYEALKERLITVYQESEHQQLQKLLGGLELGDQKPTQLLRRMRDLGNHTFPDEALRVIWMNQMPTQIRAILSANTEVSLDSLATIADKMMEHTGTASIATVAPAPPEMGNSQFELLTKQIEEMSLEIAELRANQRSGARRRYRSRSRTPAGTRRKPGDAGWLCRYHYRFGNNARRCESPCAKSKKKSEN